MLDDDVMLNTSSWMGRRNSILFSYNGFQSNPPPTKEMMDHFREVCTEKERQWAGCPPEALEKMRTRDPTEAMKEYGAYWEEADANKDGALDEEEWLVFMKFLFESSVKNYGWAAPRDDAFLREVYAVCVAFTPNEKGVTHESMLPYQLCAQAVRNEQRAAAAKKEAE